MRARRYIAKRNTRHPTGTIPSYLSTGRWTVHLRADAEHRREITLLVASVPGAMPSMSRLGAKDVMLAYVARNCTRLLYRRTPPRKIGKNTAPAAAGGWHLSSTYTIIDA